MDMESVDLAIQGRLVFQPEQSKLIQGTLMAQSTAVAVSYPIA
jgi:hypothetical protein